MQTPKFYLIWIDKWIFAMVLWILITVQFVSAEKLVSIDPTGVTSTNAGSNEPSTKYQAKTAFSLLATDSHQRYAEVYGRLGMDHSLEQNGRVQIMVELGERSLSYNQFVDRGSGSYANLEKAMFNRKILAGNGEIAVGRGHYLLPLGRFFLPYDIPEPLYPRQKVFENYWRYTGGYASYSLSKLPLDYSLYFDLELQNSPRPEFKTIMLEEKLRPISLTKDLLMDSRFAVSGSGYNILEPNVADETIMPYGQAVVSDPQFDKSQYRVRDPEYRLALDIRFTYLQKLAFFTGLGYAMGQSAQPAAMTSGVRIKNNQGWFPSWAFEHRFAENDRFGHFYAESSFKVDWFYLNIVTDKNFDDQAAWRFGFQAGAEFSF